jgi:hypothetical protein
MLTSTKQRALVAFAYIVARLNENSTMRSLIYIVGALVGISNPSKIEMILPIAMTAAGLIGALLPDQLKQKPPA